MNRPVASSVDDAAGGRETILIVEETTPSCARRGDSQERWVHHPDRGQWPTRAGSFNAKAAASTLF